MILQKISAENHAIMQYHGFKIKIFDTNYHVYVPDKWYTYVVNREKHLLYDPQKRLRGEYIIKSSADGLVGNIKFYTRYSIESDKPYMYIKDNETNKIISEKIKVTVFGKPQTQKVLKKYLEQKYPNWENPLSYWS